MLDHAREALSLARGRSRADLDTDRTLALALTYLVIVVGEAAAQVPENTRARYPDVPWRAIVGMRHRLVHGYDYVDLDQVWAAATDDLPPLIAELERILPPEDTP